MRPIIWKEENVVGNKDYKNPEERQQLTPDAKWSRLECLRKYVQGGNS